LFTDVMVACENTPGAAPGGAGRKVSVKHAVSMLSTVSEAEKVLGHYARHQKSLKEAMRLLVDKRLRGEDMLALTLTRPVKSGGIRREDEDDAYRGNAPGAAEVIMRLADSGRGTGIPGVRGAAHGFLNAVTEYADHYGRLPRGQSPAWREANFESKLPGAGARFKQNAFDLCLAAAAWFPWSARRPRLGPGPVPPRALPGPGPACGRTGRAGGRIGRAGGRLV
jgi:hypothetical protein